MFSKPPLQSDNKPYFGSSGGRGVVSVKCGASLFSLHKMGVHFLVTKLKSENPEGLIPCENKRGGVFDGQIGANINKDRTKNRDGILQVKSLKDQEQSGVLIMENIGWMIRNLGSRGGGERYKCTANLRETTNPLFRQPRGKTRPFRSLVHKMC